MLCVNEIAHAIASVSKTGHVCIVQSCAWCVMFAYTIHIALIFIPKCFYVHVVINCHFKKFFHVHLYVHFTITIDMIEIILTIILYYVGLCEGMGLEPWFRTDEEPSPLSGMSR